MTKYDLTNIAIQNKATGNKYIQDANKKCIFKKTAYDKVKIADFAITSITWNTSAKDIDTVVLSGESDTSYTLSSNQTAFLNRLFKDAKPSADCTIIQGTPAKKFMNFGVNAFLYEFVCLLIQRIENGTIVSSPLDVTLTITKEDTEEFTNGKVTVTAKDEDNNAVSGLQVNGTIGETEVTGTTGNDGTLVVTLSEAGTFEISIATAATTQYKAGSVEDTVTVTAIDDG